MASFTFPAKAFGGVSKEFDQEAAAVFYSGNTFSFDSAMNFIKFTDRIGKVKTANLQYIEIERDHFQELWGGASPLLRKDCPQLKRIELGNIEQGRYNGEWDLSMLGRIQGLALALPKLSQISYIKVGGRLRMAVEEDQTAHVTDVLKRAQPGFSRYVGTPLDLKHEIDEANSRQLAKNQAITRKIQATKAANRATIAAGGPAAQVLLVAKAERKRKRDEKKAAHERARANR